MWEGGKEEIVALVHKILKLLTCYRYFQQLNSVKREICSYWRGGLVPAKPGEFAKSARAILGGAGQQALVSAASGKEACGVGARCRGVQRGGAGGAVGVFPRPERENG